MKDGKSLNRNVTETLVVYGINAVFNKNGIHLKEEHGEMYGRISRHRLQRRGRPVKYCNIKKHMQSDLYKNRDEGGHEWLRCDIHVDPKKASAIINMQKQMIDNGVEKEHGQAH